MGFSRNIPYPSVEDINFQKLYPLEFHENFHHPSPFFFHPLEFHQDSYRPLEFSRFFLPPPGIFKIQTPMKFRCPQQGDYGLFLEKPNVNKILLLFIICNINFFSFLLNFFQYREGLVCFILQLYRRKSDKKDLLV